MNNSAASERRDIFAEGPVVVFKWIDEEGWPVEYVSDNVEDLLGYSPVEFTSGTLSYSELIHADDLERVAAEVERNSGTTERFQHEPYRVVTNDGEIRWVLDYTKNLRDETGEITHRLGYLVDITERKERDVRLEQAEMIGQFGSWKWSVNEDEIWWSENLYDIFELDPETESISRTDVFETIHPDDREAVAESWEDALDGAPFDVEFRIVADGTTKWVRARGDFSFDANGNPVSSIGILKDVTPRKRHEQQLKALNTTAQELLQIQSETEIVQTAVEAACDTFAPSAAAIYLYDNENDTLAPAAYTPVDGAYPDELPPFPPSEESIAWRAFVTHETQFESGFLDRAVDADLGNERTIVLPLGSHGVSILSSRDGFDEQRVEAIEMLATTTEAALDRAAKTRSLREQKEEATEQAERLEYMTNLNETIRSLHASLVEVDSRDGIKQTVCQTLTTLEGFDGAWIGERDSESERIVPVMQSQVPDEYLDEVSLAVDGSTPAACATRERTAFDENRLPKHVHHGRWRNAALAHGFRSVVSVPLQYQDILYGVLTIYSRQTGTFDERTISILEDLGTLVGYLLNSIDQQNALRGQHTTEITVEAEIPDGPLKTLASNLSTEVTIHSVSQHWRNAYLVHCSVPHADSEEVVDAGTSISGIKDIVPIEDSDNPIFEVVTVEDSIALRATTGVGAVLQSIAISDQHCEIVLASSEDSDHRKLVDQLDETLQGAEFTAKRHSSSSETNLTPNLVKAVLSEQHETVLKTAYYSGYFDKNRKRTGAEIADSLDIAQPTFSNRLRAAQRNLFSAIWAE